MEILLQIPFSFIFSAFIDFNMVLASDIHPVNYAASIGLLLIGCIIQSIGVVLELKPRVAMMSAEAFVKYASSRYNREFGRTKVCFDITLVTLAVLTSLAFTQTIEGVREGSLIAACLTKDDCRALTDEAHALGLEVLLEIHSNDELSYVTPHVDMVGINNRNLGSFHTDVQNSFRLAEDINREIKKAGNAVLVSESGISHPDTICQLRKAGYRGFLIGETFMKASAPGDKLHSFILQINNHYETEPAH